MRGKPISIEREKLKQPSHRAVFTPTSVTTTLPDLSSPFPTAATVPRPPSVPRRRLRRLWQSVLLGVLLSWGLCACGASPPPEVTPHVAPEVTPDVTQTSSPLPPPVLPAVDGDRLFADVEALSFPRDRPVDRDRARRLLQARLEDAGWTVTLQPFPDGVNLVARQPDTDPTLDPAIARTAETLIVGAHYDSVAASPGADDNASGVATLLELARLFADMERPRRLTLVLFDREEDGLLGSFAYVNANLPLLATLQGAIVLEMTGYTCGEPGCQQYPPGLPGDFPNTGDFLAVVGDLAHPQLTQAFAEVAEAESERANSAEPRPNVITLAVPVGLLPDLLRSDHAPFWLAGAGAVMVTDTANFRNPHYHRASDRPQTLDRAFLTGNAQTVAEVVRRLLWQTPGV